MIFRDNFCDEQCWVFIKKEMNSSFIISMTGNISPHMKDENLVYYRLCPDTLMALGLCIVLKKLSRQSLEAIIQKYNSQIIDPCKNNAT